MKALLQALQGEDPRAVFIARHIHGLGSAAADRLQSHFGSYGEVRAVLPPLTRVRSNRSAHRRTRAASLCFVVMASAEAAARLLRDGPEHLVGGVPIRVQPFRRPTLPPTDEEASGTDGGGDAEAAAAEDARAGPGRQRQHS